MTSHRVYLLIDRMIVLKFEIFGHTFYLGTHMVDRMAILIFLSNVPESHRLQEKEKLCNPTFQGNYFMELWFLCDKQL